MQFQSQILISGKLRDHAEVEKYSLMFFKRSALGDAKCKTTNSSPITEEGETT